MQSNYSNPAAQEEPPPSTCAISLASICLLSFPVKGTLAKEMGLDGPQSLLVWPLGPLEQLGYVKASPHGPLRLGQASAQSLGLRLRPSPPATPISAFLFLPVSSHTLFPCVCDSFQDVLISWGGGRHPRRYYCPFLCLYMLMQQSDQVLRGQSRAPSAIGIL